MACLAAAFEMYRDRYTPEGFNDTVLTPQGALRRFREMTVLVAESAGGDVIGTIAYSVGQSGEGHLRGMAVHPRSQGGGIAGHLLTAAERDLRERGCRRATLDVTIPLKRARAFYRRRGYEPTGVVTDFFGMKLLEYAKSLE